MAVGVGVFVDVGVGVDVAVGVGVDVAIPVCVLNIKCLLLIKVAPMLPTPATFKQMPVVSYPEAGPIIQLVFLVQDVPPFHTAITFVSLIK